MTTVANLLARKRDLLERLAVENLGPHARDEIERLLAQINTALALLGETGPDERDQHGE